MTSPRYAAMIKERGRFIINGTWTTSNAIWSFKIDSGYGVRDKKRDVQIHISSKETTRKELEELLTYILNWKEQSATTT